MLLHIHGFNSSPESNTFHLLRAVFPKARALAYACHGLFADNLAALHAQAVQHYGEASRSAPGAAPMPLVISGSSLGGFYASQAAARLHADYPHIPCRCVLFNPVVYPATALRPFLGCNTLFHSGVEWEFTPAMLKSYARFSDTRESTRADTDSHGGARGEDGTGGPCDADGKNCAPDLRRFVLLGRRDSLLNPAEARAYWHGHAQMHETDDEHSLAALDAVTVAALRDLGAGM